MRAVNDFSRLLVSEVSFSCFLRTPPYAIRLPAANLVCALRLMLVNAIYLQKHD